MENKIDNESDKAEKKMFVEEGKLEHEHRVLKLKVQILRLKKALTWEQKHKEIRPESYL